MRVIVCEDRELITKEELYPVHTFDGFENRIQNETF